MYSFNYWFYCRISRLIDEACRLLSKLSGAEHGKIIMFHHVTNEPVDTIESCKCTIDRFSEILIQLKQDDYHFITVDQMLEIVDAKAKDKFVVITFDDASKDIFLNAYPILKQMEIPFIVYVTTDFVNKEGFIDDAQLDILNMESLCTIGSHTITHPMLRYSNNAFNEIFQSKKILENRLGKPVYHFAYPYGKISAVSIKNMTMVRRAGYQSAMGTVDSEMKTYWRKCIYFLPRVVIN
jgi:peptidoglycan/xylan/chitin deacetylase (PgdA/CDA1 family)